MDKAVISTNNALQDKANKFIFSTLIIVSVYGVIFGVIDYLFGFTRIALANVALIPASFATYLLMLRKHYLAGKLLIHITGIVVICIHYLSFGGQIPNVIFFIPIVFSALITFQGKSRKFGWAIIALTFFTIYWLLSTKFSLNNIYVLSEADKSVQYKFYAISATFLSGIMAWFLIRINEEFYAALQKSSKQLEEKNELLEVTLKTKDKLFSIISHDLKSPFLAIDASLDLLKDPNTPKEQNEFIVKQLGKKSESARTLLQNLLMWSQQQTETIRFEKEPINLDQLRSSIIASSSNQAFDKNIRLTADFPNSISLKADKAMLESILRNLVSNAIKFTPNGGNIHISAMELGSQIVFSVEDSGVGMREDVISKLLHSEIYSTAGTNREQGHGLGMRLIHEFLKRHDSHLEIKSELGKGSLFSFRISKS